MVWNRPVGLAGSCNQWAAAFQNGNFKRIMELDKAGIIKVYPVGWDNNNLFNQFMGLFADPLGHAAVRITLPDGTVFYLDDTNRGGSDHMFMKSEVPSCYVAGPFTTAPRTPWTLP